MKNNQANNVDASSLFGRFGTTPQNQHMSLMNQQWSNRNHLLSRFHPQTQFPGQFQFSEPQSQLLAHAQYAQLQSQAAAHAHLQSQSQSLASLHNVNGNVANVASPPSIGSSKRAATQRTPLRPPRSSDTNQNVLFKTVESTPNALQRKRELKEKQIPEKVIASLPESTLYTQLLDFEAQIDDVMSKRKVDIQEAIRCPPHVQKILRIYVFNTFSNHTRIDSENKTVEESSWSLKIMGRILEDDNDRLSKTLQGVTPPDPKFSDFFKKITICLEKSLYPENHVIVWDNACSPKQQDGFEVKRKGDKEFTAVIKIEIRYSPEKFMVSPPLSKILGLEVETPPRIIAALWHYVKSKRLQCLDEPSSFICDPSLKRVFGEEKMKFTIAAQKLLAEHLSHPQPIYLEHNIKLSGHSPAGTACYDVKVDVPIPLQKEMSAFLASNSSESQKEIKAYDEVIHTSLKKIQEHHRRRSLFLSFSQSPEEFINTMIASQNKDLKLVAGDSNRNSEKEQGSKFFNQPWVEDAVIRYLNRKTNGSDAVGGN